MDRQQKLEALQDSIKPEEGGAAGLIAAGRPPAFASGFDSQPPTPPGQVCSAPPPPPPRTHAHTRTHTRLNPHLLRQADASLD